MATNTDNYGLIKPDQEDFYDVGDFNANMDKIDEVMAGLGTDPELAENVRITKENTEEIKVDIAEVKKDVGEVKDDVTAVSANIGKTGDTGGTATSGSLNAKLNANIRKWGDTDGDILEGKLNELLGLGPKYIISDTVRKTLYSAATTFTGSAVVLYRMVAEHDGKVRLKFNGASTNSNATILAVVRSDADFSFPANRDKDSQANLTSLIYAPTGTYISDMIFLGNDAALLGMSAPYISKVSFTDLKKYDLPILVKKGESFSLISIPSEKTNGVIISNLQVLYDIEEATA